MVQLNGIDYPEALDTSNYPLYFLYNNHRANTSLLGTEWVVTMNIDGHSLRTSLNDIMDYPVDISKAFGILNRQKVLLGYDYNNYKEDEKVLTNENLSSFFHVLPSTNLTSTTKYRCPTLSTIGTLPTFFKKSVYNGQALMTNDEWLVSQPVLDYISGVTHMSFLPGYINNNTFCNDTSFFKSEWCNSSFTNGVKSYPNSAPNLSASANQSPMTSQSLFLPVYFYDSGTTYPNGFISGQSIASCSEFIPSLKKTSIPENFARESGIQAVVITKNIEYIYNYAFYQCQNLVSVVFDKDTVLRSIGQYAFQGCNQLTCIDFPPTLEGILFSAFKDCDKLESVIIPDSVTTLGANSFEGCTSLTSVILGSGVTTIYASAFKNCTSLEYIDLSNVRIINNEAFNGCTSLTAVTFGDSLTQIGGSAFVNCDIRRVEIPVNANAVISDYAFRDNVNMEYINLEGATSVGNYSFSGCTNVERLDMGSKVTSIGNGAFLCSLKYTKLLNFTAPVTTIGNYAFSALGQGNTIREIILPTTLTSIGLEAFRDFTSLEIIKAEGFNAPTFGMRNGSIDVNRNVKEYGTLVYTPGTTGWDAWLSGADWDLGYYHWVPNAKYNVKVTSSAFNTKYYYFSDGIIPASAFRRQGGSIVNLTDVFTGAQQSYSGVVIDSIYIYSGITSIGNYAFYYQSGATFEFEQEGLIRSVGIQSFYGCSGLTEFNFDGVNSVGTSAFQGTGLKNVIIGNNSTISAITATCFRYCTSLETVNIKGVKSIMNNAFVGCTLLKSFTFDSGLTSMGISVFSGCTSLKSIYTTNSVTAPTIASVTTKTGNTFNEIASGGIIYFNDQTQYNSYVSNKWISAGTNYNLKFYGWTENVGGSHYIEIGYYDNSVSRIYFDSSEVVLGLNEQVELNNLTNRNKTTKLVRYIRTNNIYSLFNFGLGNVGDDVNTISLDLSSVNRFDNTDRSIASVAVFSNCYFQNVNLNQNNLVFAEGILFFLCHFYSNVYLNNVGTSWLDSMAKRLFSDCVFCNDMYVTIANVINDDFWLIYGGSSQSKPSKLVFNKYEQTNLLKVNKISSLVLGNGLMNIECVITYKGNNASSYTIDDLTFIEMSPKDQNMGLGNGGILTIRLRGCAFSSNITDTFKQEIITKVRQTNLFNGYYSYGPQTLNWTIDVISENG